MAAYRSANRSADKDDLYEALRMFEKVPPRERAFSLRDLHGQWRVTVLRLFPFFLFPFRHLSVFTPRCPDFLHFFGRLLYSCAHSLPASFHDDLVGTWVIWKTYSMPGTG